MAKRINWTTTYQKNAPKLLGVCRRYVKDLDTAQDILQEAFIVAMQKQDSYKGLGSIEGWLKKIVVNMSLNYLKTEMKKSSLTDYLANPETHEEISYMSNNSKIKIYSADFTTDELLKAIDSLPVHHKAVFNMYVIDNFSHTKIGQTLNISVGTSKSHLHRAKSKIKEILMKKAQEKESKDKKLIAFLIFIGLENKLLAHTFKSRFADFNLQPKEINASENPISFSQINQHTKFRWFQKAIINQNQIVLTFISCAIVSASAYWLSNKSYSNPTPISTRKNTNNKILNKDIESSKKQLNAGIILINSKQPDSLKSTLNPYSKNKKPKGIFLQKESEPKNTDTAIQKTDSTQTEKTSETKSTKVYVKKQIIKKDTVYVYK